MKSGSGWYSKMWGKSAEKQVGRKESAWRKEHPPWCVWHCTYIQFHEICFYKNLDMCNFKVNTEIHSYPLRYLTQGKWTPTFWMPLWNILDFQQAVMMKNNWSCQSSFRFLALKVAEFCFEPEKMGQKL